MKTNHAPKTLVIARAEEIGEQLAELQAIVACYKANAEDGPGATWGHAGDLGKAHADLANLLSFLNS